MKIHFSSTTTMALLIVMLNTNISFAAAATQIVPQADNDIDAAKKESLDHRSLIGGDGDMIGGNEVINGNQMIEEELGDPENSSSTGSSTAARRYQQLFDEDGKPGVCNRKESDGSRYRHEQISFVADSPEECDSTCQAHEANGVLRGFIFMEEAEACYCQYDQGTTVCPDGKRQSECSYIGVDYQGTGEINYVYPHQSFACYKYIDPPPQTNNPPQTTEGNGDPHFRTWKNEHFEFHGQCDLVMTKVENFANSQANNIDLEIHLRTKIVRYWSYIQSAAIRIGNDILEVEGSAEGVMEDGEDKRHYHINYEYRGPLTHVGGFPVTISPRNNKYTIDLDSAYPGQKIEINTFKEFVGVKIIGATEESFGKAVGITGDFVTGKTLARDGVTEIDDFTDLGMEWQVLPSDGKLFHEAGRPQFPELCYLPEDPRGERTRRLDESTISEEAAEAACAGLVDEFDRKGCIYDILATQDLDMVGAY